MFFAKLGDGATGDDGLSDDDSGEIEIIDEKGTQNENRVYSFSFSLEPQTEVNWEVFAAAELTEFDELSEEFLEDEDEKEANEKK